MMDQEISINLKVGSRVSIFDDVSAEPDGFAASEAFSDTVTKFVPSMKLIEFAESDIGFAEFRKMLDEHDSVQVISGNQNH